MKIVLSLILIISNISYAQLADDWIFEANSLDKYQAPTMANGMIGLRASKNPMEVQHTILNGVFDKFGTDNVQCILPGINFANIELRTEQSGSNKVDQIKDWSQQLNMKEAWLETNFVFGGDVSVSHKMYALRHLPYSALFEIELEALREIEVKIINKHQIKSPLKEGNGQFKTIKRAHAQLPILTSSAQSSTFKHTIAASSGFILNETQEVLYDESTKNEYHQYLTIKLKKGERFSCSLVGSIVSTADFQDPQTEAERQCIYAMLEGKDKLVQNHKNAWSKLWETDIVIDGDGESQKDIRFALFNLYSSVRKGSTYSIPPMGLTNLDYYGHIFWDAELWMYPGLLALKPEMAKPMIDYRIKTIGAARKKARTHGYDGVMFPWEADDLGEESTPTWALTGPFEHHITAVVGIAIWNYYAVTQDLHWLKSEGYPILKEIADFWLSRSTIDKEGSFHILNVVGADEYAENVDNNAFTNGAVIASTKYAIEAAGLLGEPINPTWKSLTSNLVIEKFKDGIVKNYKDYNGEQTKQADVNLLTYPLGIVTDEETVLKNLNYYQKVVDPRGPAMTHSIYAIIYSRLGQKKKAWELFQKGYKPNQRPPYGVLAEGAYDNNPYFMTAAGGLLQAVLFGFCGAEITSMGVFFKQPQLPKHWNSVTLIGFGPKKETITIQNQ
ncbi:glycoside hydrolase family 65 protein [Reichenbachiella sp.]|uniref:glycosyl hydrolase family 95 catalytic domain-containing protein n=1 Tax=Reichenbachiella sp. TaxID=2184521 RepID=UPI003299C132